MFHRSTAIKVDFFIAGGTPLDTEQMERRQRIQIGDTPGQHLYVYTPEDILLQKLRWFRLGNEVSDRQWRDIIGILAQTPAPRRVSITPAGVLPVSPNFHCSRRRP